MGMKLYQCNYVIVMGKIRGSATAAHTQQGGPHIWVIKMCDMATYPELPRECRWETGFECQAKRELKAVPRLRADSPSDDR